MSSRETTESSQDMFLKWVRAKTGVDLVRSWVVMGLASVRAVLLSIDWTMGGEREGGREGEGELRIGATGRGNSSSPPRG